MNTERRHGDVGGDNDTQLACIPGDPAVNAPNGDGSDNDGHHGGQLPGGSAMAGSEHRAKRLRTDGHEDTVPIGRLVDSEDGDSPRLYHTEVAQPLVHSDQGAYRYLLMPHR